MSKQNYYNFSAWRFFPVATGVVDTGGKPWAANISTNFRKKFETTLMVYSRAWGKLIHEKNQKSKISWHCPFNTMMSYWCLNTARAREPSDEHERVKDVDCWRNNIKIFGCPFIMIWICREACSCLWWAGNYLDNFLSFKCFAVVAIATIQKDLGPHRLKNNIRGDFHLE